MFYTFDEFLFEQMQQSQPASKTILLGKMGDGTEVHVALKVGHTIKMTAEEFAKLQNMRISQNNKDMLGHRRGGKDYYISKKSDTDYTIFHFNKTVHKLTPVGVFKLPLPSKVS